MTQKDLIMKYIHDFGSITPMEAFHDLGITKLATRISELKKDGVQFDIQVAKGVNRYGKATRYARYLFPAERIVTKGGN